MLDPSIHPNTRVLLDAWRRMQADPKGHDAASPRVAGNEEMIERIFVLELMQDRTWLVRSAGSRLSGLIGRRLVNHDFLDLWSGPDRIMTGAFLEAVRLDGGPGVVRGIGETLHGQRAEIEITLMPLDAGAAHAPRSRMLGLYQPLGNEAALAGQPLFRHRVAMLVPPTTRRAGAKLRLVASH
jgi:hypothetical protein